MRHDAQQMAADGRQPRSSTRFQPVARHMRHQIISLDDWWATPQGRHALAWEQARYAEALADVFGFNAVQLGVPELDGLITNRMPHRWLVGMHQVAQGGVSDPMGARPRTCQMVCDPAALPFQASSLDLVVLPHTLEQSAHPHGALREVERVLRPEGRVVISGLNPLSLWALRQRRSHLYGRLGLEGLSERALFLPRSGEFIGHWRIKDWLQLLGFDVSVVRFGVYAPAVQTERWLTRFESLNKAGSQWWPILGAVYFVVAIKRVRGMRLLGPAWKPFRSRVVAPVAVTGRQAPSQFSLGRSQAADMSPNKVESD